MCQMMESSRELGTLAFVRFNEVTCLVGNVLLQDDLSDFVILDENCIEHLYEPSTA